MPYGGRNAHGTVPAIDRCLATASQHTLYLDVSAWVAVLVLTGRYLESRAKDHCGSAAPRCSAANRRHLAARAARPERTRPARHRPSPMELVPVGRARQARQNVHCPAAGPVRRPRPPTSGWTCSTRPGTQLVRCASWRSLGRQLTHSRFPFYPLPGAPTKHPRRKSRRALAPMTNPPGAHDGAVVNSAGWRAAEIPASNGHGTARVVVGFYNALATAGPAEPGDARRSGHPASALARAGCSSTATPGELPSGSTTAATGWAGWAETTHQHRRRRLHDRVGDQQRRNYDPADALETHPAELPWSPSHPAHQRSAAKLT